MSRLGEEEEKNLKFWVKAKKKVGKEDGWGVNRGGEEVREESRSKEKENERGERGRPLC